MERAGEAAAALAADLAAGPEILVVAGPGNNGGDAFEVAARLRQRFFRVTVVAPELPERLPQDAERARSAWTSRAGAIHSEIPGGRRWGLAVDGLFGIGLNRGPDAGHASLIEAINHLQVPRLALDIPSGLTSDSGRILTVAVRATHTITFIALKPGLLTLDGPDCCGEVSVSTLGIDVAPLAASAGQVVSPALFPEALMPRPDKFHKGLAGSVGILGGAQGMVGAALLAGRAALRLGAGRVYCGLLAPEAPTVDPLAPELMFRSPEDAGSLPLDAIVAGPGIGRSEAASRLVERALSADAPCVLDADALNLLAQSDALKKACSARSRPTLLTPHPAEAGRLLGISTDAVQAERLNSARRLAERYSAMVLLKGNGTVIVGAAGRWYVNTSGNPGMASAGMGDTLAGILGALLAQRIPAETALALAAHLHGVAADELAAAGDGPVGITASETVSAARRVWNRWVQPGA